MNQTNQVHNNAIHNLKDKIEENAERAKDTSKKSLQDWYQYVETHPFQTMLFGTVVYFALKGFLHSKN